MTAEYRKYIYKGILWFTKKLFISTKSLRATRYSPTCDNKFIAHITLITATAFIAAAILSTECGGDGVSTWILVTLSAIASICLKHLKQLQNMQRKWTDRLRVSSLSRSQLWLCSRAILPMLLIDFCIADWFPTISMPIGCIIAIFTAYTVIQCAVFLFSLAAYEVVTENK